MKILLTLFFLLLFGCQSFNTLELESKNALQSIPGEDIYWQEIVEKYPTSLSSERTPSQEDTSKIMNLQSSTPLAAITQPLILEELENRGYRLENLLSANQKERLNLNLFYEKNQYYRDFADLTKEDIQLRIAEENKYRPDWGKVGTSFNEKRRNLDPRWLSSKLAYFELVGVINRIDRKIFDSNYCGELRFLYRLNYTTEKISSRMPMTINLVYNLPKVKDCTQYTKLWINAPGKATSKTISAWLMNNALHTNYVKMENLKALETNYQVIRSSSGIRNLLGGSAEYVLRVFHFRNNKLVRAKLENTIDPNMYRENPALKEKLLAYLKSEKNFKSLENGYLNLPEDFLTYSASSYSPHGISRFDNRLYDQVFSQKDFEDLDFSKNKFVRTPDAVIRRLNDLSCVGCHQNRTIAGFHFLGEDKRNTHPLNAILFAGSGHFRAELNRRSKYLNDLVQGKVVNEARPFSIAPTEALAQAGDFCGLSGSKGFSDWKCDKGLHCQAVDGAENESELGKCVPQKLVSGDPCISNQLIQNHHSLDKMVLPTKELSCAGGDAGYSCQPPGGGFPTGMCTTSCENMKDSKREICGPIAGPGFHDCLTGTKMTFFQCLKKTEKTASRGRCNDKISCRNDYICAKVTETEGACLPSYFLYQIRVDGHPSPQ